MILILRLKSFFNSRGAFRTGFRRAELLRVQKEIENIKKRSQKEAETSKEQQKEAEEGKNHVIIR